MTYSSHTIALNELSAPEGAFTTAQAVWLGITRNALSQAMAFGRAERIAYSAYRLAGSQGDFTDELAAVWKLANPAAFTHGRIGVGAWGGIAVGGSTAACLQSLGDFYLLPYHIYAPRRINSRMKSASSAIRRVDPDDVSWIKGLLAMRPERTLADLCLDNEKWSLVEDSFDSAGNLSYDRLVKIIAGQPERKSVQESLSVIRGPMERHLGKEYARWDTRLQRHSRWLQRRQPDSRRSTRVEP